MFRIDFMVNVEASNYRKVDMNPWNRVLWKALVRDPCTEGLDEDTSVSHYRIASNRYTLSYEQM
jgi:hypothetical protein